MTHAAQLRSQARQQAPEGPPLEVWASTAAWAGCTLAHQLVSPRADDLDSVQIFLIRHLQAGCLLACAPPSGLQE